MLGISRETWLECSRDVSPVRSLLLGCLESCEDERQCGLGVVERMSGSEPYDRFFGCMYKNVWFSFVSCISILSLVVGSFYC